MTRHDDDNGRGFFSIADASLINLRDKNQASIIQKITSRIKNSLINSL